MALSVRCEHCGWLLNLDDAFAGARCRCVHCGAVSDVPKVVSAVAPLPRPPRPQERQVVVQPPGTEPIRLQPTPKSARGSTKSRTAGWAVISTLMLLAISSHWWLRDSFDGNDISNAAAAAVSIDRSTVARVPDAEILQQLKPLFLDKPIAARSIAWLIEGGDAMRPYYADVTTLVATSIAKLEAGEQKFALYLACGSGPAYQPQSTAGPAALSSVQTMMRDFKPSGSPSMARAFDEIAGMKPRVVFLIVAGPTDDNAVMAMIQRAKSDEIVVYVVSVGRPNFGWARVAWLTNGEYACLRERDLSTWVDRITSPPLPQFEGHRSSNAAALDSADSR